MKILKELNEINNESGRYEKVMNNGSMSYDKFDQKQKSEWDGMVEKLNKAMDEDDRHDVDAILTKLENMTK